MKPQSPTPPNTLTNRDHPAKSNATTMPCAPPIRPGARKAARARKAVNPPRKKLQKIPELRLC